MTLIEAPRHLLIKRAVLRHAPGIVDVTIKLWGRLAYELSSIIGETSFLSLYSRSVHLASETYPWLACGDASQENSAQFADLKSSLEGQDYTEASNASIALLIIFSDTLALLIGEQFATSILRSAWGDDALIPADKEFPR
ncbi:hypothetical protein [Pollutimonas bauzanensis]|uniref:Uncharacterized protein n=1 Tax=Pollutimonas bauzanensis TaxID=658167 RepID=A0A1M5ZY43_9BURK|nr:hypothetical protein [Pollutimonas bauzanensis]SHI29098.1 hypothetical protein SAMN04488135_12046 [Pollutimonas bauzanensis]